MKSSCRSISFSNCCLACASRAFRATFWRHELCVPAGAAALMLAAASGVVLAMVLGNAFVEVKRTEGHLDWAEGRRRGAAAALVPVNARCGTRESKAGEPELLNFGRTRQ